MEVATKLAMFVGALIVALAAGWGLGQLATPYLTTFTPGAAYSPANGTEHLHPRTSLEQR
jgi:hypothetical protein